MLVAQGHRSKFTARVRRQITVGACAAAGGAPPVKAFLVHSFTLQN